MEDFIYADVRYRIKSGKRSEFIEKILENKIIEYSKNEPGNIRYTVLLPVDSEDDVCIIEYWTNKTEQKKHSETEHYKKLTELKAEYVEDVAVLSYGIKKL